MNRELKMKELQLLDATRRKFMLYQQQQQEARVSRLDDELRRKVWLAGLFNLFEPLGLRFNLIEPLGLRFQELCKVWRQML